MKVYIEAFRADGSEILGNLDGQTNIVARNYKRTHAYKYAKLGLGLHVASYRVVNAYGQVLEEWTCTHSVS